jgi:TPR repeat protein
VIYHNGRGLLKDDKMAVKWFTLAAEQGSADAQYNLGVMYANGEGVRQCGKAAVKWYTLAAEQGHANSQGNLSIQYALGKGVKENKVKAHMWANIARFNGLEDVTKVMGFLIEKMTPLQIEQAHSLARECIAKDYKDC